MNQPDIESTAPDSARKPKSWAEPALSPDGHLLRSDVVPRHRGKAGKPVNGRSKNAPPAGQPERDTTWSAVPPASAAVRLREKGQTMTRTTSPPAGPLRARPAVIRANGQNRPQRPGVAASKPALSVRDQTVRGPGKGSPTRSLGIPNRTVSGASGGTGPRTGRHARPPPPRPIVPHSRATTKEDALEEAQQNLVKFAGLRGNNGHRGHRPADRKAAPPQGARRPRHIQSRGRRAVVRPAAPPSPACRESV
jgi:hypothetical protein